MSTDEHPERALAPGQLRHAADLIDKAQHAQSELERMALLGSAREICERVSAELAHLLDPHGALVGSAVEKLARRLGHKG